MPSGAKKRQQRQRKKARRARSEPQQDEEGAPTTEVEEMASAPLTGIQSLPYEMLSSIFSFLPIPDLARCAAVCEQWHDIVTGSSRLWEGKRYRSDRSPRESAEVYAVLRALPPLREVVVETGKFCIDISYPRLILTVSNISDTGLEELTFLRRCSDVLQKLELKGCVDLPSAAYAGLGQLGNLRRLRLRDCCVEAGDLEVALKGMRRLASLELDCVSDLSCLRHCERLQDLYVHTSPPGAPLTGLRYLPAGLRTLYLVSYAINADELSEAAARLPLLEDLDLRLCKLAHLRFLRRCPQLRDLSLYDATGFKKEAYREVCHVTNLQTLRINYYVRNFVREVVRPCLPKVEIYCCGYRTWLKYND